MTAVVYEPQRQKYLVGTRRSQLALVQTESVIAQLHTFYPHIEYEVIKIKTIGDKNLLDPLANIGDKGLFTKELEIELERNNIDFVVHSLKDVPSTVLPPNMVIGAILERADPRDAVMIAPWRSEKSLDELPERSVIGTSSTRRVAQMKRLYPQFEYKNIRGNMNTRWEILANKDSGYDALIVAMAGLQRLNWTDKCSEIIEPDRLLYAIGQGALGVECRHNDHDTLKMLAVLNHESTVIQCVAERAFLRQIGGGCSIPNAVRTQYDGKSLTIDGIVLNLDGSHFVQDRISIVDIRASNRRRRHQPYSTRISPADVDKKRKCDGKDNNNTESYAHFAHVCCLDLDEKVLKNAANCGTRLARRLEEKGARNILEEIRTMTLFKSA